MNANEESSALVSGELERIARATEAACPMCELYEHKERRLRQSIFLLEQHHADMSKRLDEARGWKIWCLTFAIVLIIIWGGMAVKP